MKRCLSGSDFQCLFCERYQKTDHFYSMNRKPFFRYDFNKYKKSAEISIGMFFYFFRLKILTRDSKGLSEDQMKEFRNAFNHFDKVFVI